MWHGKSLHRFNAEGGWDSAPDGGLDSDQTLLIVFASSQPDAAVAQQLAELRQTFPRATLIGCSSSGEIYGEDLHDDAIVLAAIRFGHTRIRLAHTRVDSARGSTAAGRAIAEKLQADDLTAVFTLTDGLLLNGSAYTEALGAALPTDVVVTGGLAGDAAWCWGHVSKKKSRR